MPQSTQPPARLSLTLNNCLCYHLPMSEQPTKDEIRHVLQYLGRKGGKARVPKGFARVSPEKLAEIHRKSGEARRRKSQAPEKKALDNNKPLL